MSRASFVGTVLAIASVVSPAFALPPGYKAQADALLAASYAADGPGAQVVISEGGKIVYRGNRGLADVAAKRPITDATVFRIGSITKQFSAAVVLQLAAEGKLSLDDPLSKHIPSYPNGAAITVRQLLNHTSGIQSYTGIPGWMVEANTAKAFTTEQLIAEFQDLPAPSKPGEKWEYNNSGYVLVGALIEAVTGNRWSDEVATRIARPLGLTTLHDGVKETAFPAMAKGYTSGEGGAVAPAQRIHMSVPAAAGALIATTTDLAKWDHALHHGKVVPSAYYAQMIAPTKLADGKMQDYGFGIGNGKFRDVPAIRHSGGIFGFASDSMYIPSNDLYIAILTNNDGAKVSQSMVMNKLAAIAIGKPYAELATVAYTAEAVKPWTGVYGFDEVERTLSLIDGKLFIRRGTNPPAELYSAGADRFHYGSNVLSWIEMRRDAAGKPVMAFHGEGEDEAVLGTYQGPPPAEAAVVAVPAETLASYVGSYTTPAGQAGVTLAAGLLTIKFMGKAFPLKPIGPASFTVDQVGAEVRFVGSGGKTSGIEIIQGGRTLPGTRD